LLISKKWSTCQVTVVPRVNASVTCQFVVVLFFLFNLVPIFVQINQFFPFQIDTKFIIFYTNYINIFSKIDL